MKRYSIGEMLVLENEREVKSISGNVTSIIKPGDKAIVCKNCVKILSGDAKGKMLSFSDLGIEVNKTRYDHEDISSFIVDYLDKHLNINNIFDDFELTEQCGLSVESIKESIFDALEELF